MSVESASHDDFLLFQRLQQLILAINMGECIQFDIINERHYMISQPGLEPFERSNNLLLCT